MDENIEKNQMTTMNYLFSNKIINNIHLINKNIVLEIFNNEIESFGFQNIISNEKLENNVYSIKSNNDKKISIQFTFDEDINKEMFTVKVFRPFHQAIKASKEEIFDKKQFDKKYSWNIIWKYNESKCYKGILYLNKKNVQLHIFITKCSSTLLCSSLNSLNSLNYDNVIVRFHDHKVSFFRNMSNTTYQLPNSFNDIMKSTSKNSQYIDENNNDITLKFSNYRTNIFVLNNSFFCIVNKINEHEINEHESNKVSTEILIQYVDKTNTIINVYDLIYHQIIDDNIWSLLNSENLKESSKGPSKASSKTSSKASPKASSKASPKASLKGSSKESSNGSSNVQNNNGADQIQQKEQITKQITDVSSHSDCSKKRKLSDSTCDSTCDNNNGNNENSSKPSYNGWKLYDDISKKYRKFVNSGIYDELNEDEIIMMKFIDPRIYQSCHEGSDYDTVMWQQYFQYEFPSIYKKRKCSNIKHRRDSLFNVTKQYNIPIFNITTTQDNSNNSKEEGTNKETVVFDPYVVHDILANKFNRKLSMVNISRKINALSVYES